MYLSSYRLGDHVDRLFDLMRGKRRVGIIANALDFIADDARQRYEEAVYSPLRELSDLGAEPEYLDLRQYFGNPSALEQALKDIDLVWVLGGNAFLLRRAMRQSGFDDLISRLLREDSIVYGGFSAGAVVATRTLKGIDIMDDPHELAEGYEPSVLWEGLGLIEFSIVPHYRSNHGEAEMAERAATYFREQALPFQALRDGDAILVEHGAISLLSHPIKD
ncbi:Type 1 glutamine amidotransferase-like domain-containing protein [Rhizobium rhizogenes]|uniref:Type 1 glutamine amidotransferase-like domain-containing protein n=1 Tax=Rhizobium rhizogenes TaxID=359 RepID=UPI00226F7D23|nr:Type 1 glutamine amidotransferase-like domain-containing protein [Rhizobium rhizogenes]